VPLQLAPSMKSTETIIFIALTAAVSALAVIVARLGQATWLEAAAFVTGAICVWLVVKENIWNFPLGLLNVTAFAVVFFESGLYADAGLQVVYFILNAMGWYMWLYGGEHRTELHVSRTNPTELLVVGLCTMAIALMLWGLLRDVPDAVPAWDATTTSISLAAQWLQNRKRLESWIGWIVVDVIYVPLYIYKSLHLTAVLYVVFLIMATLGYFAWRKTWLAERAAKSPESPLGAPVA
jgi:nicotinamide mononucleotide transporter